MSEPILGQIVLMLIGNMYLEPYTIFRKKSYSCNTGCRYATLIKHYLHGTICGWHNGDVVRLVHDGVWNVQLWCQLSQHHVSISTYIRILYNKMSRDIDDQRYW